jgi:N-acetylmuramoyl-L-alanine amidase
LKVRVPAAVAMAALLWFSISLPAQQPPAAAYIVVTRQARQPLAVRTISGQDMFALDDLARLFNLAVREDTLAGGLTVSSGTQTIVLSLQQPLASVSGRMISLPAAPVRDGRVWYVPVDFVSRALAAISPIRIDLRKPSRLIIVGDMRMPRIAARVDLLGSITRVTLDVAPSTPHTVSQDQSRLILRFDADGLDAADLHANATNEVLQGVRVADSLQTIALDLGPKFASYRVSDQPGPSGSTRIVIDLMPQEGAQTPTAPQPPTPSTEPPPLLEVPPAGGLRAIVIDPGHGGDDAGAKGAKGTIEKDLTLSVAKRLKGAIEARLGVRVLLTRDADQNLDADQRAAVANNNKADLFISLHANASFRPSAAGAEVLYLGLESYGAAAQQASTASSETLPVVGGGMRQIDIVPWELAQARYIDKSAAFARAIDASLRERVPMAPRALEQAPFRGLIGVNMPAVLIELGFLTNSQQERLLATDAFQNTVVQALVDGILRFKNVPLSIGVGKGLDASERVRGPGGTKSPGIR